ncbi:beta-1,4-galactosyltransferase galt-1-like isoform X2 [Haliotis asinina]|uniref:beta-1,4-galactosyltransferase galt-1-like isoform X2 n=1 Tax=Haliotis asinina TaxID=109174 RepID=UPI003531F841
MGLFRRFRIRFIIYAILVYITTHSLIVLLTRPGKLYFVVELKHDTRYDIPTAENIPGEKQRYNFCCRANTPVLKNPLKTKSYYRLSSSHEGDAPHMYIFSAHLDVENNVVDILGTGPTLQLFEPVCVFVSGGHDPTSTTQVAGTLQALHLHTYPKPLYTTLAVHCPVPSTQLVPSSLFIPPSTLSPWTERIPVQYPAHHYRNFTVCYPAAHSDYANVEEMVQSMSINSILGAGKAFLYNHSIAPSMKPVMDYFIQCGQLELVQARVPEPVVDGIHYYGQVVVMHDCLYRNRYTSKYILFQDMDEVVVPKKDSNWFTLIERLKNKYPKGGSFALMNAFFTKTYQNGLSASMKDSHIKLLSYYSRHNIHDYLNRSKYFVIPRTVDILQVHGALHMSDFHHVVVDVAEGLLHHYRSDIKDISLTVDRSVDRFSSQLTESIRNIMNCIRGPW